MKKVLIIKPRYRTFPVGIAYVLSCLESNRMPFDFVDMDLEPDYQKKLRSDDYLAVATGGLIGQFDFFCDVVNEVRNARPDLPVILGGNITKDIRPDFLFDKIGIDYGIIGEAETCFPDLLNAIANESNGIDGIPGLVLRDKRSGNIIRNAPRRLDLRQSNILPAWRHINVDYYSRDWSMPFWGTRSGMPILSGRGCVGQCTFCSPTIGSFRMRPIHHVIEEINFLNSSYNFDWFVFFNEMFYPSKKQIIEFCEAYKKVKPHKNWVCSLRVDADVDIDTFIIMKEAGCLSISAGIESGSDKVLHLMRKRSTNESIRRFFKDSREAGLPCSGTFMIGNEGETEEDIKQTIDMIISEEMNTSDSLTNAYPGTQIYENALKHGLISDELKFLEDLRFSCGVWETDWVDRKNYLNISDIPNERFWNTVVRELRRFHTFLLNRFQAKEVSYKNVLGLRLRVLGVCTECNSTVSMLTSRYSILGIETYCRSCFSKVTFNLYKEPEFADHFQLLSSELKKAEKMVIFGTDRNACDLLRIDYFGLNYERLIGFINKEESAPGSLFVCLPRFTINDLDSIKPDTILIADDPSGDAELVLRIYYAKNGMRQARIFHLIPDSKGFHLKLTKWVVGLAGKEPGAFYCLVFAFAAQIIKLPLRLRTGFHNVLIKIYHHPFVRSKAFRMLHRML
jgi:anaerobic magnesium-protoporphyrin IX monomethyl ester cyclase